jgi:hypothetical protein
VSSGVPSRDPTYSAADATAGHGHPNGASIAERDGLPESATCIAADIAHSICGKRREMRQPQIRLFCSLDIPAVTSLLNPGLPLACSVNSVTPLPAKPLATTHHLGTLLLSSVAHSTSASRLLQRQVLFLQNPY